jgi:hypothetical protein
LKEKEIKTFILTIDYELFLGSRTGTVEKCMVEPTYRLAKILDINNSKMTVFWDILHYYRLIELENNYLNLKNDRKLIDTQISFLISNGHDIQLHVHPHWLDAEYEDGKWKCKYDRFSIHALSEEENADKIDTVLGCVTKAKQLMESEIRKYLPDYEVTTFRAGGYLIEPFIKLMKAFEYNNIYYDSSVLPGMLNNNSANAYDFRNYPIDNFYNFANSPSESSKDGRFAELPVTTLSIPVFKNLIFTLTRLLKYANLESGRIGTGSGDSNNNSKISKITKIISLLTQPKLMTLTTDGNFTERFNYMYKKVKNNSTMILHSKLLNSHTLNILREKLINDEIKFITIKNFLNDEK